MCSDASLKRNCITITGGDKGMENREHRTIPMTHTLRELLQQLQAEKPALARGLRQPDQKRREMLVDRLPPPQDLIAQDVRMHNKAFCIAPPRALWQL